MKIILNRAIEGRTAFEVLGDVHPRIVNDEAVIEFIDRQGTTPMIIPLSAVYAFKGRNGTFPLPVERP